jgi:hypothetical protein
MATRTIVASALIPAPPERVYAIIADYQVGHQRILPRPPFVSMLVEEGGVGAGTRIKVEIRLLGAMRSFRAIVSEPIPGRKLVESNDDGVVTSFLVDPQAAGTQSAVTISTALPVRGGLLGAFEAWLIERLLRPTYLKELAQLAEVATT